MKVSLSESFRSFFVKHNAIEFEHFLPDADRVALLQTLESAIPQKKTSKEMLWASGRNIWKNNPTTFKLLQKSSIGEVASFLYKKKPIRLGYTQAFLPALRAGEGKNFPFPENSMQTLQEISSFSPILGGVFLCLDSPALERDETAILPNLNKQKKGHAIFFSGDYLVPFSELVLQSEWKGLLVCFVPQAVRYILQPLDVLTHCLKKEGYTFGDLVKQQDAPYLYH